MTEYICNMNRLDWAGNEGGMVRRGERFEMSDEARATYLLSAGYISEIPAEEPVQGVDDPAQVTDGPDIVLDEGTVEHIPSDSWTIPEIKDWLDSRDLEYPDRAVKADLLELVNDVE